MARGAFPSRRRDGAAWQATDSHRVRRSNKPLGFQGVLVGVRGDWASYKCTFGPPAWNEAGG
eukprot:9139881-Pyramimonas_sp.AAC.1